MVLWLPWIGFLGYRYYRLEEAIEYFVLAQEQKGEFRDEGVKFFQSEIEKFAGAQVQFFLFGLAAPPAIALAAWWVSKGFARRPR